MDKSKYFWYFQFCLRSSQLDLLSSVQFYYFSIFLGNWSKQADVTIADYLTCHLKTRYEALLSVETRLLSITLVITDQQRSIRVDSAYNSRSGSNVTQMWRGWTQEDDPFKNHESQYQSEQHLEQHEQVPENIEINKNIYSVTLFLNKLFHFELSLIENIHSVLVTITFQVSIIHH